MKVKLLFLVFLRLTIPVFFVIFLSSCWHRQCPINGCQVRYEHSHGGQIVRGRGTFPRIHFFGIVRTIAAKKSAAANRRRKQKK